MYHIIYTWLHITPGMPLVLIVLNLCKIMQFSILVMFRKIVDCICVIFCRIDETVEDSLYTGFCPEDLESEAEFTYCTCNTNTPDTCSDEAIIQNCAPALKTKRGKKRGNHLVIQKLHLYIIL